MHGYPRRSATSTNSLRKVPSHVQPIPPGWNCRQKLFPHSRVTASTSPSMLPHSPQFRCQLCVESRQGCRRRHACEGPGHVRCHENQGKLKHLNAPYALMRHSPHCSSYPVGIIAAATAYYSLWTPRFSGILMFRKTVRSVGLRVLCCTWHGVPRRFTCELTE